MKNKIVFKLIKYFSASLILFSIVIGSIFMVLFKNHTVNLHKADLQKRAVTIADNISEIISGSNYTKGNGMMGGMMGSGYGSYIRYLDDIAMADVWIVDENLDLITIGYMANQNYNYSDLPEDAESVVKDVFTGNTTFSEGFSKLLKSPTLTVGTPIKSGSKVVGALLIHSPVEGMNDAVYQGFGMLGISMFFALAISILLSIILAISFTNPLKKMKNTALKLSLGDYSAKTNVYQQNEIGELASSIDVLSTRLDEASKESENLEKLRKDFIANISHELRTPVTVIRGSLEALCDEVVTDPEQVKEYYFQMLNESKFLQRLVNDLLDLSRLQNINFKIEMNEINLYEVLIDVVRSSKKIAEQKNIDIIYENDTDKIMAFGDYSRLRQMFFIIVDNAVKFSPENSNVYIILKNRNVTIKDRGSGIEKSDLPYIFDRFYKVQSEENKNGTGLGLSIAKEIAERHNINVTVISNKNEGTEFLFHFNNES